MKEVLYLLLLAYLLSIRPLRRLFSALSPSHRVFLVALFSTLFAVQWLEKKSDTYPFVYWGMYSDAGNVGTFFEFKGIRADGSEAEFPVADLLRVHSLRTCPTPGKRLPWLLRSLGERRYFAPDEEKRRKLADTYDRVVRSAWDVYRSRHPEADFVAVDVYMCEFRTDEYVNPSSIWRQRVWRVDLATDAPEGES